MDFTGQHDGNTPEVGGQPGNFPAMDDQGGKLWHVHMGTKIGPCHMQELGQEYKNMMKYVELQAVSVG